MMAVTKIETKSGFTCEIDESRLDDAELLFCIQGLQKGDMLQLTRVVDKILGPATREALFDYLRTDDDRVPYEPLEAEIADIFTSLNEKKKS